MKTPNRLFEFRQEKNIVRLVVKAPSLSLLISQPRTKNNISFLILKPIMPGQSGKFSCKEEGSIPLARHDSTLPHKESVFFPHKEQDTP
jgi:hypothetical protein